MKTLALLLSIFGLFAGIAFAQKTEPRQSPPYVPDTIKKGEPAKSPAKGTAAVQDVKPDEAEELLKHRKEIVVLDVRTPDEFAAGHLKDAKNIDFLEMTLRDVQEVTATDHRSLRIGRTEHKA